MELRCGPPAAARHTQNDTTRERGWGRRQPDPPSDITPRRATGGLAAGATDQRARRNSARAARGELAATRGLWGQRGKNMPYLAWDLDAAFFVDILDQPKSGLSPVGAAELAVQREDVLRHGVDDPRGQLRGASGIDLPGHIGLVRDAEGIRIRKSAIAVAKRQETRSQAADHSSRGKGQQEFDPRTHILPLCRRAF